MNKNIKPSQNLLSLIDELKDNLVNVKYVFSRIENRAREEGLEPNIIDDMIYQKYKNNSSSVSSKITTTTADITTSNNTKNEETKYFQRYFQHFQ